MIFHKIDCRRASGIDNTEAHRRLLLHSTAAQDYVSTLPPPFGLIGYRDNVSKQNSEGRKSIIGKHGGST